MSHFTCIKTQIKERPYLIEALEIMGHDVQENKDHDEEEEYSESVKKRVNKLTGLSDV